MNDDLWELKDEKLCELCNKVTDKTEFMIDCLINEGGIEACHPCLERIVKELNNTDKSLH